MTRHPSAAVAVLFLALIGSLQASAKGPQANAPTRPGGNPDAAVNAAALSDTDEMLRDPALRKQGLAVSPTAGQVDKAVGKLAGSGENADAIYGLAADIMAKISAEADGDPVKMQQIMGEAAADPAKFAAKWSAEDQGKLKAISDRLPASQAPAGKPLK